jgi:hypothetical protein
MDTLWLVYSPICNANWALTSGGGFNSLWVENVNGQRGYFNGENPSKSWTTMVYGGLASRACLELYPGFSNCTNWY